MAQVSFAKPLLVFHKGEITPAYALRVEKSKTQELTFFLPTTKEAKTDESLRIKSVLENKLQNFPGLKLIVEKPEVLKLQFQGPDTPLLQALSQIDVSP
jgi:hypothetical protein